MLFEKMRREHPPEKIVQLPEGSIDPSPYQARTSFDPSGVESLAESIRANGLLQPVSVRRTSGGRYELIAGERRLRACRLAGMQQIPAIILQADETTAAVLGYVENAQRSDLDCFDQARALRLLLQLWGCTQEEGAARLGMSQSALCNKLRLLQLSEQEQEVCLALHLTERHARAVLSLHDDARRLELLQKAGEGSWSVAQLEQKVRESLSPRPRAKRRRVMVRDVRIFVNTINKAIALMKNAGIAAESEETQADNYIEYRVRIPVHSR